MSGAQRHLDAELETKARHALEYLQLERLNSQFALAWETDFYRRKFEGAGLTPADTLQPSDLWRIPVTRKEDICRDAQQHPPYGSRLAVAPSEIVSIVETSGTSGKGREVHVAASEDLDRIIEMEATGFVWVGIGTGTVVAFTIPITMTAASTWWNLALHSLKANSLRLGHLETLEKLRYMARYEVEVLIVTPTYLGRLEHLARQIGLDPRKELSSVRAIVVAGEARSAMWARKRNEIWGATVYEQWGCTQGVVAWSCEEGMAPGGRPGIIHGLPHLALMEVVNPEDGRQVRDGEYGELVITPLGVAGAPLIRFATGDKARFRRGEHCVCGRAFDGLEAGSVSRYDDMIKVKGVNVWPSMVSRVIDGHHEIQEYRVTAGIDSEGREGLTIEIEFQSETPHKLRSQGIDFLKRELRSSLGFNVGVIEWAEPSSLADDVLGGASWKARRWRDLRGVKPTSAGSSD